MRGISILIVGLAAITPAMALPFVVDDFTTGVPDSAAIVGNGSLSSRQVGSMFGGSRAIVVGDFDSAYGLRSSIDVVPGLAAMSNDVGNSALFWLAYLSTGTVAGGYSYSASTDIDMSGIGEFEIDVLSSDKSFVLNVWFIGDGVSQWSKAIGPIASPTTIEIGLSDLVSSGADMTKIDTFYFEVLSERDGDLALTKITAVPEPATLAVVGAGIAALIRRRRK